MFTDIKAFHDQLRTPKISIDFLYPFHIRESVIRAFPTVISPQSNNALSKTFFHPSDWRSVTTPVEDLYRKRSLRCRVYKSGKRS